MEQRNSYPLIIIGAGPAGLTASIYASRYNIEHLVLGEALGGLAFEAHKICNFPSEKEISGGELVEKFYQNAKSSDKALILLDKVIDIVLEKDQVKIVTRGGKTFFAKTILLALGTKNRHLNLTNEHKYIGKGVSYCATCDGMFYRDKTVAVIGGSDSANTTSLYLSEIAKKVYQIYRKEKLRGMTEWINQIKKNKKIEVINNTEVISLKGNDKLEKIILNSPYQGKKELKVDGLFIEIGTIPDKIISEKLSLETDSNGYIKIGKDQKTNQKRIWAAGDITNGSNNFHQIITASSEGAIAAEDIFKFLKKREE